MLPCTSFALPSTWALKSQVQNNVAITTIHNFFCNYIHNKVITCLHYKNFVLNQNPFGKCKHGDSPSFDTTKDL